MTHCPCVKCMNTKFEGVDDIERHLHMYGMSTTYTRWIFHGERIDRTPLMGGSNLYPEEMNIGSSSEGQGREDEMFDLLHELQGDQLDDDKSSHHSVYEDICEDNFTNLMDGNRNKILNLHKSVSKSFTTKFQEMKEVNLAFHEVNLFQAVYSNSDGVSSNDQGESDHLPMVGALAASQRQMDNDEKEEDSTIDRPPPQTPHEVLINFLGHRPGYIKGIGNGPKPLSRSEGSYNSSSRYQESQRVIELERVLAVERKKLEDYVSTTEARLEKQDAKIAMLMRFMNQSQQPPPNDDHLSNM